jgi:dTMP kinase
MLITFEGLDGAGKSTQARRLFCWLESRTDKVLLLAEPGGTDLGVELRRLLEQNVSIPPVAKLGMFIASRAQLVRQKIKPALEEGYIVICDRFLDSTTVYQAGVPEPIIRDMNALSLDGIYPDLTLYLDIDPVEGLRRKGDEANDLDRHHAAKGTTYRAKYFDLMVREPHRWRCIEPGQIEVIEREIRSRVLEHEKFPLRVNEVNL